MVMSRLMLLAAGGRPTENLSIFDPASPPADSIRNLSILVFAISAFIFLVVEGVLFYSIFRFRQNRATEPGEPPQVYGSKPIEIAWTAAPLLIVFLLVLVTTRTEWEVNADPPEPKKDDKALFVTVIGRQWWWEYTYEYYDGRKLGFTTANELHVPASEDGTDRPVYLTLKSADVCHSFWVPRLAGKTDLIPGRTNHTWFQTKRPDLYLGQCAEYCGTQHANMLLRVYVDSPKKFDDWLKNEGADARPVPGESAAVRRGRELFLGQSCSNCHAVRGVTDRLPGRRRGGYAPDLTHLMSRKTLASGMIENDPEGKNLAKWVDDPQEIKPGCLMPAFGLSAHQRKRIVAYLRTLH
jgi:cytochrome c oxidase subunit 2